MQKSIRKSVAKDAKKRVISLLFYRMLKNAVVKEDFYAVEVILWGAVFIDIKKGRMIE